MQLDPNTVLLREEFGSRAFFPDSTNSHFEFPQNIGSCLGLTVEGSPHNRASSAAPLTLVPFVTPETSGSSSSFRQLVPVSRMGNTINVKVIQATMRRLPNGKHEFTKRSLMLLTPLPM